MVTSGSDTGRQNMTGLFSNSSEEISAMMNSGLINKRRKLLKDAGTGTYTSRNNETFISLISDQKTTTRIHAQDVIAGAH